MDRGQIHTLEAFLAALLIVGALLFATQATAVTPLSASTANQHIENQHQAVASDLLRLTAHDGSLQAALLYWNASGSHFTDTRENRTAYSGIAPDDHPLEGALETAFGNGELAYNVELTYQTPAGATETQPMFDMGTPSDHAVAASRTVTLYEGANLTDPEYEDRALGDDSTNFWAPDVGSTSSLYNVVEVTITVWRM